MIVNDQSWYVVRNTPGVTGFVGSGTKPIPLTDAEVEAYLEVAGEEESKASPCNDIECRRGSPSSIQGPFENFPATVEEIDQEKGKLKVLVDMFGRETTIELDFSIR
jgi:transcriptional antiterminator NusG